MNVRYLPGSDHCLRFRIDTFYLFVEQRHFSRVLLAGDTIDNNTKILRWHCDTGLQTSNDNHQSHYLACDKMTPCHALCVDEFVVITSTQLPRWQALHPLQADTAMDYLRGVAIVDDRLALHCDWPQMLHRFVESQHNDRALAT